MSPASPSQKQAPHPDLEAIRDYANKLEDERRGRRAQASPAPAMATAAEPGGAPVYIALSGGGFRATLSALGALRLLADIGALGRVEVCSSVSGGSIASGLLAMHWKQLQAEGFTREAFDRLVVAPFVDLVGRRSLQMTLYRNIWRTWGPRTFTHVLITQLNTWFYGGLMLEALPRSDGDECRFVFNSADLRRGKRFAFEQAELGEWGERRPTEGSGIQLAQAVAASCSVPGVFPPLKLKKHLFDGGWKPFLADGGVYDTLALDPVDQFDRYHTGRCLISVGAGGFYKGGPLPGFLQQVFTILRSGEMSLGQVTVQRTDVMRERFNDYDEWRRTASGSDSPPRWARRGVIFELASRVAAPQDWLAGRPEVPPWAPAVAAEEWGQQMANVHTSLARMNVDLCRSLIHRSWWLTGATLAAQQPELLPPERYPRWVDWSGA